MGVHERTWRPWDGAPTGRWTRIAVLPRYAMREMFRSKLFTSLLAASFVLPLVGMTMIWLRHNLPMIAQAAAGDPGGFAAFFAIDARFFLQYLSLQSFLGFLVAVIAGPTMVTPDLVNGALPLYLARPISRADYVIGKLIVLVSLLSAISWAPGLLLWIYEASLERGSWWLDNLRIAFAVPAGSLLVIAAISFWTLAVSAWVRNRAAARAVFGLSFIVPMAVGGILRGLLGSKWPAVIMPAEIANSLWAGLLGVKAHQTLPTGVAAFVLCLLSLASLMLLARKLRAFEVVR